MENTAARKRKQVPEGYLIIGIDPHKKRWLDQEEVEENLLPKRPDIFYT